MKYFRSFLIGLLVWVVSYTISDAQTLQLTVSNQQYIGTDFYFDIYLQATSGTVFLGQADLVLTFNSGNFTNPTITRGVAATWQLFSTDLTPVGSSYRNATSPIISSNEIQINLNGVNIGVDQTDFDALAARIDNNPYRFGNYKISGITNPAGTMGLTWKTSGGGLTTQVYTFANTPPFNLTIVTLSTPAILPDAPLPVELTSFTSKLINEKVQLNWSTKTEVNNYGFNVERKINEGEWNIVGFVEGNGNSSAPKEYTYTDKNLIGGSKFLYRLKQIDNDGQFEYSDAVEVEVVPNKFELSQNYPNPFNPTTKIRYQLPNESKVVIKVYNILGSEVMELINEQKEAGIYEVEFKADNLSSGTYIYKISADNFVQTKKMILLK